MEQIKEIVEDYLFEKLQNEPVEKFDNKDEVYDFVVEIIDKIKDAVECVADDVIFDFSQQYDLQWVED